MEGCASVGDLLIGFASVFTPTTVIIIKNNRDPELWRCTAEKSIKKYYCSLHQIRR